MLDPNVCVAYFYELFQGRDNAYGTWSGGSVKENVDIKNFVGHLTGNEAIGIYPLTSDGMVRWGCSDIDVDDLDSARNLQTAFALKEVSSFVEKTRRGYHVWVFADGWVSASVMRRSFFIAHQVIGLPPKEVNPKQESSSGLGNYVRLPYPSGLIATPTERVVLSDSDDSPISLSDFLEKAIQSRVSEDVLSKIASLYVAPEKKSFDISVGVEVLDALSESTSLIAKIWREGPLEGVDRSTTLAHMCHLMRENGMPIGHAFALLVDADKRWGKFHFRDDGKEHLIKMLEFAYNKIEVVK